MSKKKASSTPVAVEETTSNVTTEVATPKKSSKKKSSKKRTTKKGVSAKKKTRTPASEYIPSGTKIMKEKKITRTSYYFQLKCKHVWVAVPKEEIRRGWRFICSKCGAKSRKKGEQSR